MTRRPWAALAALAVAACDDGSEPPAPEQVPAAEHGRALAQDPAFSGSRFNAFACSDCHVLDLADDRIVAGAPLPGAAGRPTFWGGAERDLKGAVDACVVFFMKGDELDPADPDARALYEFLLSIEGEGPTDEQPFTLVARTLDVPARGDPTRGAEVHRLACEGCHGAAEPGAATRGGSPQLPDQARDEAAVLFPDYPPAAVFTEKVRHGQFFGIGGTMPAFSLEALSDEDLGALLAFYGL